MQFLIRRKYTHILYQLIVDFLAKQAYYKKGSAYHFLVRPDIFARRVILPL